MISCCLRVLDVEQIEQGCPQGRGELGADHWEVEYAQPPLKQSTFAQSTVVGSGDRYGFRPVRSSVHDSEEVGETFDAGRGPARSTWIWLKQRMGSGVGLLPVQAGPDIIHLSIHIWKR
jgi:hypothetical protein